MSERKFHTFRVSFYVDVFVDDPEQADGQIEELIDELGVVPTGLPWDNVEWEWVRSNG